MSSVDCWRLLGVSPDASAAEVRAGFARRLRDVHPDGGGTGDGLTLSLLLDARDEALALLARREGRRGGRARADETRPSRGGRRQSGTERTRECAACRRTFFRHELVLDRLPSRRSWSGDAGERVPVCLSCATEIADAREKKRLRGAALAILAAGSVVLVLLVAYATGGA